MKIDRRSFFNKAAVISSGRISLSEMPGFGIEWDESKIQKKEKVSFLK